MGRSSTKYKIFLKLILLGKKNKKQQNKRQIKRHKSLRANTDDPDLPNPVSDRTADLPSRRERRRRCKTKVQRVKRRTAQTFQRPSDGTLRGNSGVGDTKIKERDSSQPGSMVGTGPLSVRLLYSPPDWSDDLHATNRFRCFDRQ